MAGKTIEYSDSELSYEGYLALPGEAAPIGLVVIGHAWGGPSDHERGVADRLAMIGYAAFAYDIYGKGNRATDPAACEALMTPLVQDRAKLQSRLALSIATAQKETGIAKDKTVGIGYCFGGLCALDEARAGMDVAGVASFHGLFFPADNLPADKSISAKVLIMHGYDDPMATPDQMKGVLDEMTAKGADTQLIAYTHTGHAFTNKGANDKEGGMFYRADVDTRSWMAMTNFLEEVID
ncbi:MAG: carboxymethylenebutenolidase [Ponticaulis sp.]|nr:carboxymethylenebutenolidase [Ponticaulis sp.]|tara:strand:- start:34511 stop:35224 length:714 start_codon:yes stop_codon:yes gene_type:complete